MFTNVNLSAPIGALALMGTSLLFLIAAAKPIDHGTI